MKRTACILYTLCITLISLLPTNGLSDSFYTGTEAQIEFSKLEMSKALEYYHNGDTTQALALISQAFDTAKMDFTKDAFFYHAVWKEAQIGTGQLDANWGFLLFKLLWDREVNKNPWKATRPTSSDFLLLGNIMDSLTDAGRRKEAMAYLTIIDSTLNQGGLDTTCQSYSKTDPIFSFELNAWNRKFPLLKSEAGHPILRSGDNFIYYPNMYVLLDIAELSLRAGQQERAAELCRWYIQYTDEYIKKNTTRRFEICSLALDAYEMLAEICTQNGAPEAATHLYEEYIEKLNNPYAVDEAILPIAKLKLALIQLENGTPTPEILNLANEAIQFMDANSKYWSKLPNIQMQKARILDALGRGVEAWALIDQVLTEAGESNTPYRRIKLLPPVIKLATKNGANHPDLENWFIEVLEFEKENGDILGELPVHNLYVEYLRNKGRTSEAEQLAQNSKLRSQALREEFIALAEKATPTNATDPLKGRRNSQVSRSPSSSTTNKTETPRKNKSKKAALLAKRKAATKHQEEPEPQAPIGLGAVVLPAETQCAVHSNESAHGRFYIYNPSTAEQEGELSLSGNFEDYQTVDEGWVSIHARADTPHNTRAFLIKIPAGKSHVIDIIGTPLSKSQQASIECSWTASYKNASPVTGVWNCAIDQNNDQSARIVNTHTIDMNEGYLTPVSHTLIAQDGTQPVDFKTRTTGSAQIEVYEGLTGELLSIDANGDGDYDDEGDEVLVDNNNNGWPDLVPNTGTNTCEFTVYIRPLKPLDRQRQHNLNLLILAENDEWQTGAKDTLRLSN